MNLANLKIYKGYNIRQTAETFRTINMYNTDLVTELPLNDTLVTELPLNRLHNAKSFPINLDGSLERASENMAILMLDV